MSHIIIIIIIIIIYLRTQADTGRP